MKRAFWKRREPESTHGSAQCTAPVPAVPVPRKNAGRGQRIIVAGAGPGGLLAAILLSRRGYQVAVYEKRKNFRDADPHSDHYKVGLGLMYRGIKNLLRGGITWDEIRGCGVPVRGYRFVASGRESILPILNDQVVLSIERKALMNLLLARAQDLGVEMFFEHKLDAIDFAATRAELTTGRGERVVTGGAAIIGADGANSTVRACMQRHAPRFSLSQSYYERGWKSIILERAGRHGFAPHLITFYGGETLTHAGFIPGDRLVFTLCLPCEGPISLHMTDAGAIAAFLARHLPELWACHPDIVAAFRQSPAGDFVSVHCSRFDHGRVLLLGDSAHAMVPFLGQGMNCALEDAGELHDVAEQLDDDWEKIPRAFTAARKPHADAIAQMSLSHYQLMCSSRALDMARIAYQCAMHRRFSRWYRMDLGTALSLTDIPFAALRRMQEQHNRWYRFGRI